MIKRFLILLTMLLAMFGCTSYQEAENNSEQGSSNSEQSNPGQNNSEQGNSVNKSAAYKVMHYKQNANDSEYTLVTTDTENKTGTVGDYAYATVKSYEGFTAKQIEHIKIKADGSTVVKIFYDRKEVTLMLNLDGGTGNTMITGKYGANINIQNPTKADYVFSGWEPALPTTFPLSPSLHTATWIKESDTVVLDGCTYTKDMKTLLSAKKTITSVVIPDSVTSIGWEAFYGCSSLTSVVIPDSVTYIASSAFSGCSSLESISVSENNTEYSSQDGILYDKEKINIILVPKGIKGSVTIPDSVTSIGWEAFEGCSSLESISVSENYTEYSSQDGILYDKEKINIILVPKGIKGSVTIPDSVTSIGGRAFEGCSNLTSVTIGNGVTYIASSAFSGCSSLESISVSENNTEYSSQDGILYDKAKTKILYIPNRLNNSNTIPDSVEYIEDFACDDCKNLNEYDNGLYFGNENNPYFALIKASGTYITLCEISDATKIIADGAFYDCKSLTSVVIPDSVTTIGKDAFYDCSSLTSVTIGNSVTSIGKLAFYSCSSLTSVTIPDSVTEIGEKAFVNCKSLTSITIGNGVTTIGKDAFSYAYNPYYGDFRDLPSVKNLVIGDGLTSLANLPITSALESITIGNSVTSIGWEAFYGCNRLTSVTIGDGVTEIGMKAFYDCSSLTSVEIPDSVTSIGNYAFENCSSLTSVTIGDGVTEIGEEAFYDCSSLTSVTIGNSVTSIGKLAFYSCSSLTSVTIPDSVTSIGERAFSGCGNVETLVIGEGLTSLDNLPITNTLKSIIIGTSITSIGENEFKGCSSLTSVKIPDSVTSIGNYAFNGCGSLTSITIPDSVTSIGNYAFNGCGSLTSITIPDSVTSIGGYAFKDCSSLIYNEYDNGLYLGNADNPYLVLAKVKDTSITSYEINSKTKIILSNAFNGCENIETLIIGDGITSLDNLPITSALKSLAIPKSVTEIKENQFKNCINLSSITIPASVTSIGKDAFSNCDNLANVYISDLTAWCNIKFANEFANPLDNVANLYLDDTLVKDLVIPDDVTAISSYAFSGCYSLTNVTIPDNVTAIGDYVFNECSNLASVTIGNGVTSVGKDTFYNSGNLTSVYISDLTAWYNISFFNATSNPLYYADNLYLNGSLVKTLVIPDSVTSIGKYAFYDYDTLTSITIPASVTSIGKDAFSNCDNLANVYIFDLTAWCNIEFANVSANPLCYADNLYLNSSLVKTLVIPDSVTSIGKYAFYNYDTLTSVKIPDSVTSIGESVFYSCGKLATVTIGSGVTTISYSAFYDCDTLTSVTIPDNVTTIGEKAFYSCNKLATVTIGNGITRIYKEAFYNCNKLTSVTFKDTDIWYYTSNSDFSDGIGINVTDPAQNATYLESTYKDKYWYKK